MAREISSISRFGLTEPFELQVARGQITGHRSVTVFGYNNEASAMSRSHGSGQLFGHVHALYNG
jgi:hypothetical protein